MTTLAIIVGLLVAPLLLGTILNRATGRTIVSPTLSGCLGLTFVFCFTGLGHFLLTDPMARMLPPWVPGRIELVYATGVLEIAAALALLIPRLRRFVGGGLIVLLIVFLPVNIYAALNHVPVGGHEWGPIYLLIRVPLQFLLMAWTWRFALRPRPEQMAQKH